MDSGGKWCSNIYVYELLDSVLGAFCYAHTGSHLMLLSTLGVSSITIPNFQVETLHFGEIRLLLRVPLLVMIEPHSIQSFFCCFQQLSLQVSGPTRLESGPSL